MNVSNIHSEVFLQRFRFFMPINTTTFISFTALKNNFRIA